MRHFAQNKKRLPPRRPNTANPFAQFRSPSPDESGEREGGGIDGSKLKGKAKGTGTANGKAKPGLAAPQHHHQQQQQQSAAAALDDDAVNEQNKSPISEHGNTTINTANKADDDDDEEEDYLTMALPTTTSLTGTTTGAIPPHETSLQRRQRLAKEGAARGRVPSKAELAAQERQRREEGLARSLFFDRPRGRVEDEVIRVGGGGAARANGDDLGTVSVVGSGVKNAGGGEEAPLSVSKSKGLAMMAKMGFRPGERLGAARNNPDDNSTKKAAGAPDNAQVHQDHNSHNNDDHHAITEPIRIQIREDRGGIGLEGERKRKLQAAAATLGLDTENNDTKKKKPKIEDEADYRVRMARERDAARKEKLIHAAQKIAERMDEDNDDDGKTTENEDQNHSAMHSKTARAKPLNAIPVVYRALVRNREQAERDRRMRHDLETSLSTSTTAATRNSSSKLPIFQEDDDTFDSYDRFAIGGDPNDEGGPRLGQGLLRREVDDSQENDDNGNQDDTMAKYKAKKKQQAAGTVYMPADDLDTEDAELDAFDMLDVGERLAKSVAYLRDKHRYCFWCKLAYPDKEMEGCPGPEEEDHD